MLLKDNDQLRALHIAVTGLTYPSESDEPFEVFSWNDGAFGSARDALLAHIDRTSRIEQVTLERFFSQLDAAENADQYRRLQRTLASNLADLSIFRVGAGEVRVDVYLLGCLDARTWAGLHTVSVET